MMSNESYTIWDYFRPDKAESDLRDKWKLAKKSGDGVKEALAELKELLADLRGVIYDEHDNPMLSDVTFVEYILSTFKVIKVSGNIAFYNFKKKKYQMLDDGVYLVFFKKLLDEVTKFLWQPKIEARYHARFIREIEINLVSWSVPSSIVFLNGVYDISKRLFIKGDNPDIYNFETVPVIYDVNARCPKFMEFLKSVTDGDNELQQLIKQMGGYTFLYGSAPKQVVFLLIGVGRNGKGVLTNILSHAHGANNVSAVSVSELSNKFGVSAMYDKVLNISAENSSTTLVDTSIIKTCTGGDTVMVEFKYRNPFPSKIYTKFIISSNDIHFNDTSVGFLERIIPVPFNVTYVSNPRPSTSERKIDVNMEAQLLTELPGIINYFLEGLFELMDNQYVFQSSQKVNELKLKMISESNPVRVFFDNCILINEKEKVKKTELRDTFYKWAQYNKINISCVKNSNDLYRMLENILRQEGLPDEPKRLQGIMYYKGIDLPLNAYKISP